MAIERIRGFIFPTTQPSVFESDSLTVVELTAKTAHKVNECVDLVNTVNERADLLNGIAENAETILSELEVATDAMELATQDARLVITDTETAIGRVETAIESTDEVILRAETAILNFNNQVAPINEQIDDLETRIDDATALVEGVAVGETYKSTIDACNAIRAINAPLNQYRIATFNAREANKFSNAMVQLTKHTVNANGSDICCFQEMQNIPDFTFLEKYTSELYPMGAMGASEIQTNVYNRTYWGNAIISRYALNNPSNGYYTLSGESMQMGYQRVVVNLGGIDVAIYNTHLYPYDMNIAKNQIAQLYAIVTADPISRRVIVGDFNNDVAVDFAPFTGNGYTRHNTGEYLTYKTTPKAIDNIITSNNLIVTGKGMVLSGDESDHNLFYIDFKL